MIRKGFYYQGIISLNEAVCGCKALGTFPGAVHSSSDERAGTECRSLFPALCVASLVCASIVIRIAAFEMSMFLERHRPVRADEMSICKIPESKITR